MSNPTRVGKAKVNRRRCWYGALLPSEVAIMPTEAEKGPRRSLIVALVANITYLFDVTKFLSRTPAIRPRMKIQIDIDDS